MYHSHNSMSHSHNSMSHLPLHMIANLNPDNLYLYNSIRSLQPSDFSMIDDVYDEIDVGNDGLLCEIFTEDGMFVHEEQKKNPDSIESFKDENDIEYIEDESGHVVIIPSNNDDYDDDDDDDSHKTPSSPKYPPPPINFCQDESPCLHESPRTPSPISTSSTRQDKPTDERQPLLHSNVTIKKIVNGPDNTIRYYIGCVQQDEKDCYIPSHILEKGGSVRVGDCIKAIMFSTPTAKFDYRVIKCLSPDEMISLQFRLTLFGEDNIGVLIGYKGKNLERLSRISSPPDSTYFPRLKVTKKYKSIVEITYKKNSHINKNTLIDHIKKTFTHPEWAVSPQYIIESFIE